MAGVHWLSLLTLQMRPEAEIQTATQQILGPRPDLLETVVSILMERFPLLTRKALLDFSGPADLAAWLAQHGG